MKNSLSVFNFESNEVRFVDGKPVGIDVAAALGYSNPSDTILKKVFPENKLNMQIAYQGQNRTVAVLEEAGIYQLIFSSKLESAQKFQQWVFSEVLPQIRKTGSYQLQPETNIYVRRLKIAAKWNIPQGYWCVFHEVSLLADKVGEMYNVGQYDLLDGSVGSHWSKHRKDKEWAVDFTMFPLVFGDKRDYAFPQAKAYKNVELPFFRDWVNTEYKELKMPKYLHDKYKSLIKL